MSAITDSYLTCDGFAERLADYLEGDASEAARAAMERHAAGCEPCAMLLADLQALPAQAAALPPLQPSGDLWAGIAERIDTRVLPLDAPRSSRVTPFMQRRWVRPAMAAAALMIVTAGVTHYVTRAYLAPAGVAPQATTQATTQVATMPGATVTGTVTGNESASVPTEGNAVIESSSTEAPTNLPATSRRVSGRSATRLVSAEPLMEDAEPVYDREITKLRAIVRERRSQLDPATVAVLEQSVKIIDSAIAQSRAALAKDPASGFLANQLNHSLEKKVELLRTAALLPART